MKRADGALLRHTDPMYRIAAHVMAKRSDSMNSITVDIPLAPIDAYLRQKRREGHTMSHMAVIMAAYLRMKVDGFVSQQFNQVKGQTFVVSELVEAFKSVIKS